MRRTGRGIMLVLGIGFLAACSDSSAPEDQPIRLSATMKLAADSLTVTLRVLNVSDTTQVLEWGECIGQHPADFAVYRDAGLNQLVWKAVPLGVCGSPRGEMELAPDQSGTIRGIPTAVDEIMAGGGVPAGRFYVAIHPHSLTIRPKGGSYDMPVDAKVPAGPIDLAPVRVAGVYDVRVRARGAGAGVCGARARASADEVTFCECCIARSATRRHPAPHAHPHHLQHHTPPHPHPCSHPHVVNTGH